MTTLSKKSSPNYIFEDVGNREPEEDKTIDNALANQTNKFEEEQINS